MPATPTRRQFLGTTLSATLAPLFAHAGHFTDGRSWFGRKRFGMFIHWGIYAGGEWHEQHMFRKRLTREQYARYMREFNPVKFDPEAWLDLAAEAGMEYINFTTKHVDGFCMWDTKQTDYNITRTPYGKDVLAMLAAACHRRGVPLCLYYSCADMHHPNYPNAGRDYELPAPAAGDQPDLARYLEFVKAQVRELCTYYGTIHGFWWDANVLKHRDPSINTLVRSLQPSAVINNRGYDEGDFGTPERDWYNFVNTEIAFDKPVEACQSVGFQSWGWRKDEDYYADAHLIRSIQKVMAKGGNYLPPLTTLPRRATLLNTGESLACDVADLPRLHKETPDRCLRVRQLPVNERAPPAGCSSSSSINSQPPPRQPKRPRRPDETPHVHPQIRPRH